MQTLDPTSVLLRIHSETPMEPSNYTVSLYCPFFAASLINHSKIIDTESSPRGSFYLLSRDQWMFFVATNATPC